MLNLTKYATLAAGLVLMACTKTATTQEPQKSGAKQTAASDEVGLQLRASTLKTAYGRGQRLDTSRLSCRARYQGKTVGPYKVDFKGDIALILLHGLTRGNGGQILIEIYQDDDIKLSGKGQVTTGSEYVNTADLSIAPALVAILDSIGASATGTDVATGTDTQTPTGKGTGTDGQVTSPGRSPSATATAIASKDTAPGKGDDPLDGGKDEPGATGKDGDAGATGKDGTPLPAGPWSGLEDQGSASLKVSPVL